MDPRHGDFMWYALGAYLGGVEDIPRGAPPELLPLERFDHPNLHCKRAKVTEDSANAWADITIGKACAGLRRDLVCSAPELRGAIRAGVFTDCEVDCFGWTLGGLRIYQVHELYTMWRHSMYELARAIKVTRDGNHPLSRWLNLWGANPERPLPEDDRLTEMERARHRGYPWPNDPLGKGMPVLSGSLWGAPIGDGQQSRTSKNDTAKSAI